MQVQYVSVSPGFTVEHFHYALSSLGRVPLGSKHPSLTTSTSSQVSSWKARSSSYVPSTDGAVTQFIFSSVMFANSLSFRTVAQLTMPLMQGKVAVISTKEGLLTSNILPRCVKDKAYFRDEIGSG